MKKFKAFLKTGGLVTIVTLGLITSGLNPAEAADLRQAEKILGAAGSMQEDALVLRFPRSDIKMTIEGEPMPTALGLVSWTAWKNTGKQTLVVGDLALLEKEISPVISALAEANIFVTSLHNHFLNEQPRIMYMHIHGSGPIESLAQGVKNALNKTATPQPPPSPAEQPALALDTRRIEQIMGRGGQTSGGVFKITVGRSRVKMSGVELTATLGLNSWAGFVGTKERAHVAGDVAMTAREVNQVIRALRGGGIAIVAVHNHMLEETPRIFFLHYWGTGPAEKLAQTIRAAFDQAKGAVR